MRPLLIAALAGLAFATAVSSVQARPPAASPSQDAEGSRPAVTVTRDGDNWTAEYELDRDAPVWAFFNSALLEETHLPWRPDQWRVVTPGVVLERSAARDILRTTGGGPVPRRVQIAFTPRPENLEAEYEVLVFTDGSVGMPSGLFDVFPLPSVAAVADVPHDLTDYPLQTGPSSVTWRDRAGPVLFRGQRVASATAVAAETYVLFGEAELAESEGLVTVIDPQLPPWIGAAVKDFAPSIARVYARRLGPGQSDRPMVMLSWNGPTPGRTSMGGSVLPGMVVMKFDGAGVVEPSAALLSMARWFIGHESAHFWLGQVVRYERARDAWITEGGADLMAIRAVKTIDPTYDARAELQKEVDDCIRLADQPVVEAAERGEHRANYACGAVFAMVAEGAQRRATGGDWFDFLKPLIDASREDGVLTRDEWLDALDAVSGNRLLRQDMETLLDHGSPLAAELVAGMLGRSGVPIRREAGRVVLE